MQNNRLLGGRCRRPLLLLSPLIPQHGGGQLPGLPSVSAPRRRNGDHGLVIMHVMSRIGIEAEKSSASAR
jgi:hypothetical protein